MTTPLFPMFEKRVTDAIDALIATQVTPWAFLTAGPPFQLKRFDGREISYQGIAYEGSPQDVFWGGYIEPFLEDLASKELEFTVNTCKEREVDARKALPELQGALRSGCGRVYSQMAEVDRRLRGHGDPASVPLRPIDQELHRMGTFIQTRVDAELAMWHPRPWEKWYEHNKLLVWLIGILVTVALAWLSWRQKPALPELKAAPNPPIPQQAAASPPSPQPRVDPLRAAIDKFEDYNAAHPEVDVAIEKGDDAQYMAIWRIKMTMLGSIEDLAKSLHREKEVEALMDLKNNIRVESKAAPLRGN